MNLIDQELNSSKNLFMAFFVTIVMNPNFFRLFFCLRRIGPKQQTGTFLSYWNAALRSRSVKKHAEENHKVGDRLSFLSV